MIRQSWHGVVLVANDSQPTPPLPKFGKPPVSEVVMSVQFDPLSGLAPIHLGRWWKDERRERYPITEERPPLEPTREEFGPSPISEPRFNLRLLGVPPTPAVWFLTQGRTELLQIQRDRFTRNWTKGASDQPYPSYDNLWPAFEDDFNQFCQFLSDEGIGDPAPIQCELTYVNPIAPETEWERHGQLDRILLPWSGQYSEGFLSEPEDVQVAIRYKIPGPDGEPAGRLYVTVQPVWSEGPEPKVLMTLSARGRPFGPGIRGAMAFLDRGHEWIVRAFTTLTTPAMHARWERYQ